MSRSESRKKLIALCIMILELAFMTPAFVGAQAVTLALDMYADVALIAYADLNTTLLTPMSDSNGDYCGRNPHDPRCPPLP